MLRVTWRNLFARKVRLLLSAFAIVLGVAFVAGSMIFTDAMGGAFDDIIEGSTADVEIAYKGAGDFDSGQDNRTFPAAVVEDLERLPEVESAHPLNSLLTVFVIGKNGKVIGGNGPPGLANNPTAATSLTGKPILTLERGEYPNAPKEIALDIDTVEKGGFKLGDQVKLATPGNPPVHEDEADGRRRVRLRRAQRRDDDDLRPQVHAGPVLRRPRRLLAPSPSTRPTGVSQRELAEAAQKVLPEGLKARTGDEFVEENKESLDEVLGFLQTFLLVFAGVALVVGIFLIINTFSILVAQRSRELALLRAMGASRRQVNRSVLIEAVAVGLVGSTVGLGVGYLLALGLRAVFGADRAGPEPRGVPGDLADRGLVVRRRGDRHGGRGDPARPTGLPDPADGRAARRRRAAGGDPAAPGADRHGTRAWRWRRRWRPGSPATATGD